MARPFLYVAVKFARLSQTLRSFVHYLITAFVSSFESSTQSLPDALTTYICGTSLGIGKPHSKPSQSLKKLASHQPRCGRTVRRVVRRRLGPEAASLLNELQFNLKPGDPSVYVIAAQDRCSLRQNLQLAGFNKSLNRLDDTILCLTGALLGRLYVRLGSHALRGSSGLEEYSFSGEPTSDQSAVDFQCLLWSLHRIALEATIRYFLNIVEAHTLHSHLRWQYSKRIGEEWYAEWPNSHRPLSTTWPWNIKPSLFVLWGVCWMFYPPDTNQKGTTRNPRGAARLSEDLRTGPLISQSQPRRQQDLSEAWAGPDSNTYPNNSWLHPTRAGVARHASGTIRGDPLPTPYATGVPSYPYISTPSSSSSDLYPTSTVWPYCQGINPVPSPAYAPSSTSWQTQSPFDPTASLVRTPQPTDHSNIVQPYAQRNQTANTGTAQGAAGILGSLDSIGSLGLGLGLHLTDMQDYPSPGSSNSAQTASSYVSVLPSNAISPAISLMQSPSIAGDTASRQSSRRSQEPPRNTEGLLFCDHAEHAQLEAPVFSRKCEWRKHMDKHERPYVCEEPECDNIRGFTYSGGLLRHQREVHRQHGGPKASCMCPYPDCKRHVGVGFSRKENLAEHLRRVHRDAGADQTQKEASPSAQNTPGPSATGKRRRRAAVPDDESGEEEEEEEEDLEHEVKKLKRQLRERDERLEKLERQVQLLVSAQKK